jgi:hypothetical protein
MDAHELAIVSYHPGEGFPIAPPDLGNHAVVTASSQRLSVIDDFDRDGQGRILVLTSLPALYQRVQTVFGAALRLIA